MSVFSAGNLITLGALLGALVLSFVIYHQINRRNRALDKLREYGRRLKDELAAFVAEKEAAVKDYGVSLEVQRKAAKELLKRLALTNDEMTSRAEAIAKLDERIKSYDGSLGELDRMTGRVMENLNRLRNEAPFVENAVKRVSTADERLKSLEQGLQDIESRFEQENAKALDKTAQDMLGPLRSTVAGLEATAETLARKAEDHRAAVDAVERHREAALNRDLENVNRLIKNAVEQAGARADKLEEATLTKLREQATDRLQRFQTAIEDKLKGYQDSAKTRIADIQGLLRNVKEEWRADNAELEHKQRDYRDEWKHDVAELKALAQNLRDEWKQTAEAEGQKHRDFLTNLEASSKAVQESITEKTTEAEKQLKDRLAMAEEKIQDFESRAAEWTDTMERQFLNAFEDAQRRALETADQRLGEYQAAQAEQFRRLESLADDTLKLDGELRRYVAETFTAQTEPLKTELANLEQELESLKDRAYDNVSEKLKVYEDQFMRDLSSRSEAMSRRLEEWIGGLDSGLEEQAQKTRDRILGELEQLKAESGERLTEIRTTLEEVRAKTDNTQAEIFTRIDEQAQTLDAAIKDADRHIKEFISQTKLFDQAETLKKDLERRLETMQGDIDRLNQHRAEAADLEAQFVKIKRLEDDVNAKMTRFLSEKRRIELMENDFNRLIQTSQAVEEKLVQVSASDDILQAMQVQIRKLSDALADTEEQYQRIEKKTQTLETTNTGIDRNFRALQDAETELKRFTGELDRLSEEQDTLRSSVERLSRETEGAQDAAEKLTFLAGELPSIEKRIQNLQVAREWLARTETRLSELDKDIQDRVKLVGSILKDESGKPKVKGAPPIGTRESVVKLARQGWKVDEIARAVKLSKSEVELILEISPKD